MSDQSTLSREVQVIASEADKELSSLRSISPDTDEEKVEALTGLIRGDLDTLVTEARRVGRPRYHRAVLIYGDSGEKGSLKSNVDDLIDALGLTVKDDIDADKLDTLEEAQLIGSAGLLVRYVEDLRLAFEAYFATPAADESYSGRSALADLRLAGIAQTVNDLRSVMARAGLSQAESQTAYIAYEGRSISIDNILYWVTSVAENEGPRMIADSGRPGLKRVLDLVRMNLLPLVEELMRADPPHPALARPSVQEMLIELAEQLEIFCGAKEGNRRA